MVSDVIEDATSEVSADESVSSAVEEAAVATSDTAAATSEETTVTPAPETVPDEPTEPETPRPRTRAELIALHPEIADVLPSGPNDFREFDPDLAAKVEYATEQKTTAKLRREAGNKENTRENIARVMRKHNLEVEDPAELDFMWELASANARVDQIRQTATEFGSLFGDSEVGELLMERLDTATTIEEFDAAAKEVAKRAVEHDRVRMKREMDGSDITEDGTPTLYKWVQEQRDEAVAAERAALAKESQSDREPRPNTSSGQVPGASATIDPTVDYASAARAYNLGEITKEYYAELREGFGVRSR